MVYCIDQSGYSLYFDWFDNHFVNVWVLVKYIF